ncbi:diguanylate cyclase domain-containing protein [Streptomyces sp. NPDC056323]
MHHWQCSSLVRKNRFKAINNVLGHAAGDTVLASIGCPLKSAC